MSIRLSLGALLLSLAVVAVGCSVPAAQNGLPIEHNLPPAQMLMHPGPGVGGPGPGVLPPMLPSGMNPAPAPTVQVWFTDPESCEVRWDVNRIGAFDSDPKFVPFKRSFVEGGVYRLKVTNIEGFEGETVYPSLEIGPVTPRTSAFIAHSAIPVQFTNEDMTQVTTGNYVTKVVYIPDPEFQELAIAGIDTIVNNRLDPGVDPIVEADRRGSILAIIRIGNKTLEDGEVGADVRQASHFESYGARMMRQSGGGAPTPYGRGMSPNYVSGVTAPPYGMPMTGTPIGLPGPPHIPLGIPAGLQRHTMTNHTAVQIPEPTSNMSIHVQQSPGLSYPRPADRVLIKERTVRPGHSNRQHPANMQYGTRTNDEGCVNCTIGD